MRCKKDGKTVVCGLCVILFFLISLVAIEAFRSSEGDWPRLLKAEHYKNEKGERFEYVVQIDDFTKVSLWSHDVDDGSLAEAIVYSVASRKGEEWGQEEIFSWGSHPKEMKYLETLLKEMRKQATHEGLRTWASQNQ